jgi:hypothetical protein
MAPCAGPHHTDSSLCFEAMISWSIACCCCTAADPDTCEQANSLALAMNGTSNERLTTSVVQAQLRTLACCSQVCGLQCGAHMLQRSNEQTADLPKLYLCGTLGCPNSRCQAPWWLPFHHKGPSKTASMAVLATRAGWSLGGASHSNSANSIAKVSTYLG